jgi:hypothetical protein
MRTHKMKPEEGERLLMATRETTQRGREYGAPEPDETNPVASWFNTETPSLRFAEPSSAQGVGGEDGSIIR